MNGDRRRRRNPQTGNVVPVTLEGYITALSPSLWLQADLGDIAALADGADVAIWDDQSTNALDVTQSSAKPTYQHNILNTTLPVVRFNGTDDNLRRDNVVGSTFLSADQGTFVLVQFQLGSDNENTTYNWSTTKCHGYITYANVLTFDHGNQTVGQGRVNANQPAGWDDAWHIIELNRTAAGVRTITVDGTQLATSTASTALDVSLTATLSIGADGTICFGGDMYMLLIFKTAISTAQLNTLRALISTKTGIAV